MKKRNIIFLCAFAFCFNCINYAYSLSIDFENCYLGQTIYKQYLSDGIVFSDNINGDISNAMVISEGNNLSDYSLLINNFNEGLFLLFEMPVNLVEFYVYEIFEQGPSPDDSVYAVAYGYNNGYYALNILPLVAHSIDIWSLMSFTNYSDIAAIHLFGTQEFKVDDIAVSFNNTVVPEISTFIVFGVGFLLIALFRRILII